jgi:chorismate dehydratase
MKDRIRLGLTPEHYCAPVFRGLDQNPRFECKTDVVTRNAIRLREHELDAAFLSMIDYARESSDYSIIPGIAVSSRTPTNSIVLLFKEGLHTITTIAVNPASTSEIVLASILLGERFDVHPQLLPMTGSPEEMLGAADAVLFVGNEASVQLRGRQNTMDLVEEWNDLTDLPFVHGFWSVREPGLEKGDITLIQKACRDGLQSMDEIARAVATTETTSPDSMKAYLRSFSYTFGEEEQEAVTEFLRYAYYHGVLPDIADLTFYSDQDDETSEPELPVN